MNNIYALSDQTNKYNTKKNLLKTPLFVSNIFFCHCLTNKMLMNRRSHFSLKSWTFGSENSPIQHAKQQRLT